MYEKKSLRIYYNNKNHLFIFLKVLFFLRLHFIKIIINERMLRK
jgi:hypothetical protein